MADTTSAPPAAEVPASEAGDAGQEDQDLSVFVQTLLTQMMSDAIVSRIDEMGDRIDGLEKSIADLMNQAGADADEDNALADSREANETAASAQDEEVSADAS